MAIMLIVPVGAMVVTVEFLMALKPALSHLLPLKFGKLPLFPAISADVSLAVSVMNFMIFSPSFSASSEA